MQSEKIFDLSDIKDLPDHLKKEVKPSGYKSETLQLLSLFDMKEQLTVDELIVGMYRKIGQFGTIRDRRWIKAALYRLEKRGKVKRVKNNKNVYQKIIDKN